MSIELSTADMDRLAAADAIYFAEGARLRKEQAEARAAYNKQLAGLITIYFGQNYDGLFGPRIEFEPDSLVQTETKLDVRVEHEELQEISRAANLWSACRVAENEANGYMPPPNYVRDQWRQGYLRELDTWADAVKSREIDQQAQEKRSAFRIVNNHKETTRNNT